jgi:hypothetical protein
MKLDLYKKHKAEYIAQRKPTLVKVGPAQYLCVEGKGKSTDASFQEAIGALYACAFPMKMASKFAGRNYTVCKMEGLWSQDEFAAYPVPREPKSWNWKLLIRVPDFITAKVLRATKKQQIAKGKPDFVNRVKLIKLKEATCVQILHVGPYDAEQPTINAMLALAASKGLKTHGMHHEIYLSDPRRVPPERLRTILRHPVN